MPLDNHYRHLGVFSDLVTTLDNTSPLFPLALPGPATQQQVKQCLAFDPRPSTPLDVRTESQWERDGVAGELVSWSVGYGPRTEAYVLRPAGAREALPGMLALHDHGGFKYFGKEKIADGPGETPPVMAEYRRSYYGDRAYATALAREGYVVLVADTFLWGSRRFPLETMPETDRATRFAVGDFVPASTPPEVAEYNTAAIANENTVAKYLTVLGTTLAGVINFEDRVAASYLESRPDVQPGGIGCIGLSGGGLRAGLLQGTDERIRAAVVVGLMTTYEGVLDHNISSHTWMLYPHAWGRHGDWPDLVACRAPSPLLVQYDINDELFTPEGQRAAHERLQQHYVNVGAGDNYTGQFYAGPHKFDLEMQAAAFGWLKENLRN